MNKVFFIVEIDINHGESLDIAKKPIDTDKKS